jgi:hypothetical protein
MLLYGGEIDHVKSIYGLMNVESDERKFGLVILRVCSEIFDVDRILFVSGFGWIS